MSREYIQVRHWASFVLSHFPIFQFFGFACFRFSVLRCLGVRLAPILTPLGSYFALSWRPFGAPLGTLWLPCGSFGSLLAPFDSLLSGFFLVSFGSLWLWSYLELSEAIWSYLVLSGAIWSYQEVSGVIRSYLKLSGTIRSYLELFGAI